MLENVAPEGGVGPAASGPRVPRGVFWAAILVAVLGAAALVYMRIRTGRLEPHAFPGFELSVPPGKLEGSTAYARGRAQLNQMPVRLMNIEWEPGGLLESEALEGMLRGFAVASNISAPPVRKEIVIPVPGAAATKSYLVSLPGMSIARTEMVCGVRLVTIMTIAHTGNPEETNRRVAPTFRCRLDPAQEQRVGEIPVVFDLGPKWFRLASDPQQVQLTDLASHVAIAQVNVGLNAKGADKFLTLSGALPGLKVGARQGDSWPVSVEADGEALRGALQVRDCPEHNLTLLLIWLTTGTDVDAAPAALDRMRCRKPGEPAEGWPVPPPGAVPSAPAP
jgi:hypothetical protein